MQPLITSFHLERRFPATKLRIELCVLPVPNAVQKRGTAPQQQQQHHHHDCIDDLANTICFEEPLKVATMKINYVSCKHLVRCIQQGVKK
jgi:hypothetical protein